MLHGRIKWSIESRINQRWCTLPAVAFQRAELRKHGRLTNYGQGVSPTLQASTKRGDYETNVLEPIGFRLQRFGSGEYTNDETASTLKAYKDHTDLVAYRVPLQVKLNLTY